jgi:hypothetical protein
MLALPNLQNALQEEIASRGYAMEEVLVIRRNEPIFYHSVFVHGEILNYHTFGSNLYDLVQVN